MEQDISNYQKIREDSERFYRQIGRIKCPALNDIVFFNSEGFNHLIYKSERRERDKSVQIMKFKLLPRAKKLLEITNTYQEYEESLQEFQIKKFKNKIKESKMVRYWGIIAILDYRKFKVVIRQIGENGQKHFWSVIPAWVTNQYRDLKLVSTMKGNPQED